MYLKHASVAGVVMVMAAIFASVAAPLHARTPAYGGIGDTVANFYAANPHGQGKPPAGTTSYRVDEARDGRVVYYHVVVGWTSKRSASGLLARLTRRALPRDAQMVKPYDGYCAVYRSHWLGKAIFGLPRRFGTRRVYRTGYIIVYAPTRAGARRAKVGFWWNGASASLEPICRG